ncbi:RNA-guided endonuclease TnpB family protein, partial [Streptomyces sp. NPDC102360]
MKLVVRVKLLPTPAQALALEATLHACNEAANWLSAQAFAHTVRSRSGLQALAYRELKAQGLSAQPALHVLRKVADAYTTLKANLKAKNLGRPGSKRHTKATGKPITFRAQAAQPFDDRCLSWQMRERTVSIWTTTGRLKQLAFTGSTEQLAFLEAHRKGESDLLCQDGQWYLIATCEIPETEQNPHPAGFVGVDLGIVNIATTSTDRRYSGRRINRTRERDRALRSTLQKKGTKSAK